MEKTIEMFEKPKGLENILNKLFGSLYRLGIIRPLKARMLMMSTTGRHSGKKIQTPINYIKKGNKVYVFSIYKGSDWLKNIQKNPKVELQIGKIHYKAKALVVDDLDEKAEVFQAFIEKIGKRGAERYYHVKLGMETEEIRSIGEKLPTIRFDIEK